MANYPDFNITGQISSVPISPIGDNTMLQGLGFPLRPVSTEGAVEPGLISVLVAKSEVTQAPTGLGVPLQVTFGPQIVADDATMDASGALTFTNAGAYLVFCSYYVARTTGQGESLTMLRFLINGQPIGNPVATEITDSGASVYNQISLAGQVPAGTVLTTEILRDSNSVNDGGLVAFPSADGWGTAPSAIMRVLRF